jgi:hypothetical protein
MFFFTPAARAQMGRWNGCSPIRRPKFDSCGLLLQISFFPALEPAFMASVR